jgi:hypothetical protein
MRDIACKKNASLNISANRHSSKVILWQNQPQILAGLGLRVIFDSAEMFSRHTLSEAILCRRMTRVD